MMQIVLTVLAALVSLSLVAAIGFGGWVLFQRLQLDLQRASAPPPALAQQPPDNWWDNLQSLVTRMNDLEGRVSTHLADAESAYKLARQAEERTRKRDSRARPADDEQEGTLEALRAFTAPPPPPEEPETPAAALPFDRAALRGTGSLRGR